MCGLHSGYFLVFGERRKKRYKRTIVKGSANLYTGRVISFLIKFLDMQFAFPYVLGFSSGPVVANHKRLISGTMTGGAILVHTHAKAAFQA